MSMSYYDITTGPDGRPPLTAQRTYDVDTAHHFLADHAANVVVVFDHNATVPDVSIYTTTPDGLLSPGDYYLWPLLHQTSERLQREINEKANAEGNFGWYYDRRRLGKWRRRIPLLTTLIRIRKATIQALCAWDLTDRRPADLIVLDTKEDLTGFTVEQVLSMAGTVTPPAATAPQ